MSTIAYLRVSTDEQVQSGLGLEAQLEAIRKAFGEPGAIYRDEGCSGKDPKRAGLLGALSALRRGYVLAVAKRDRLARDCFLSAWIEKEAKRRGARVVSAAGEGTDGEGPTDILMRRMVDAFAEYERAIIGSRTAEAMAQKRRRGEYTGGESPFGFALVDGRLVADEGEQEALGIIRELRGRGYSLRQICRELEGRGISRRGRGTWQAQTVANILKRAA